MIYWWHFDRGVPFYEDREGAEELGQKLGLAVAEQAPKFLLPGERRVLTPGLAGQRFSQHVVHVSEDGQRATFTVLSIRFDAVFLGGELVFLPENSTNDLTSIVLPDQCLHVMVALPGEEPGMVRIVDLVYYYSGEMHGPLGFPFSVN